MKETGVISMMKDSIFKTEKGFYFWDEIWAYKHGPYKDYDEASRELDRYIDHLNNKEGIL